MTGPIKPFGSSLAISEINTGFALGTDLGVYHGVRWYFSGNLVTGTFSNTTLHISDFYGKQPTDPATPNTIIIDRVGSGSFTVPLYRNTITFEAWGGGGGGGTGYHDGQVDGNPGNQTTILGLTLGGGAQGIGGFRYGTQSGPGGNGGTASGTGSGSPTTTVLTNGNAGGGGNADANVGGAGGAAPNGGAAGSAGSNSDGGNGGIPGSGGGGGGYSDHGSKDPNQAAGGGGGSGAYGKLVYGSGAFTTGATVSYTIGAGGAGGVINPASGNSGGNGANGRVKISWT